MRRSASGLTLLVALVMAVLVAAGAAGVPASGGRVLAATASSPAPASGAIEGDDACALLTDEDLVRASGAAGVSGRVPGGQQTLPAGCSYTLTVPGGSSREWTVTVGAQATGGAARFEQEATFGRPHELAGIGDRALVLDLVPGGIWHALRGDTFLVLTVDASGTPLHPAEDIARLLLWRAVQRLDASGSAGAVPTPAPTAAPEHALVERLRAPDFSDDTITAAIELLARSGIATYDRPDAPAPIVPVTQPASPVELLRDQVRAMALEAWAGGGVAGTELETLIPAEPGLANGAEVLAGYVGGVDTEGARAARELIGEIDPRHPERTLYPQLVLILMASDVVQDQLASAAAEGRLVPQPVRPVALAIAHAAADAKTAAFNPCGEVKNFVDGVIAKVFEALKISQPKNAIGRVLVSIWNFVVSLFESAARELFKQVTQSVLDFIGRIAGTVGLISMVVSLVRPWTTTIVADPPVTIKGIDGRPGQEGRFVARVDVGKLDEWPAWMVGCAKEAGRTLPNLKPEGARVTWLTIAQAPGDLMEPGKGDEKLDKDGVGRLPFVTLIDDVPEPRTIRDGWIDVTARIERPGLRELRELAIDTLIGALPPMVKPVVQQWVAPILKTATSGIDRLLFVTQSGSGTVQYHVPAPTPPPTGTPEPTARPRTVMVRVDRPASPPQLAGTILELVSCDGPYGRWSGVLRLGGLEPGGGFKVPFADFPLAFAFRGTTGVQATRTSIAGVVHTNVDQLSYDVRADLDVVTDGRTLSLTGDAVANNTVVVAGARLLADTLRGLPIVAAPAGSCP